MAQQGPEFEVFYRNDPGAVRRNANLPGELIFTLGKLSNHALHMEKTRESLEAAYPGFGKDWTWQSFGLTTKANPVQDFIGPYLDLTRAESMKGSEQVVRGFQGQRGVGMDGVGIAPDLTPIKKGQVQVPTSMVVIANDVGKAAPVTQPVMNRIRGLGR